MRWHEIVKEGRFKEIATLLHDLHDGIGDNAEARADFVPERRMAFIFFNMDGEEGRIALVHKAGADADVDYGRKVMAAAMAASGGKRPKDLKDAVRMAKGRIGRQALKVLTNPQNWDVVKVEHSSVGTPVPVH